MNEQMMEQLQYNELMNQVERFCISGFGRDLLRRQRPTAHLGTVRKRLQETSEARAILDATAHVPFIGVSDMEVVFGKLDRGMLLEASELEIVAEFSRGVRKLKRFMSEQSFLPRCCQHTEKASAAGAHLRKTSFRRFERDVSLVRRQRN